MRLFSCLLACLVGTTSSLAEPLSKAQEIDFFREVPNRNLKGLAVRSDGRVTTGPVLRELSDAIPADLLWTAVSTPNSGKLLLGTGPEGKVISVSFDGANLQSEVVADLESTHVFALLPLDADTFLAGTSPQGAIALVRRGEVISYAELPVDSVFDFTRLADGTVLVATGNPGRIYRIDLGVFEKIGRLKAKPAVSELAAIGLSVFGEIRDRNIRRLLSLSDGRIVAGSAPKGNIYSFPASGGAPLLLLENREAEVTDLLPAPDGSFYAALTLSGGSGESRVNRPAPAATTGTAATPPPPVAESVDTENKPDRFSGRGQLVHFPVGSLPETVVSRNNTAFYRLAWHGAADSGWVLITGGEQGELIAYAPSERRSLNLGASASAQVNAIVPVRAASSTKFYLLRNNPAGLSELDFEAKSPRSLETRKLDLGSAAEIGQVRFENLSDSGEGLDIALRTSFGSDELEGWSSWRTLEPNEGGWYAEGLRGRFVQLRITAKDTGVRFDEATLYHLPQNRRPLLADFRIFPANLGLLPANDATPPSPTTTLGQMLAPTAREAKDDAAKRRSGRLNSPVVPAPGAQIVYWSLTDADNDNLAATFSISPEGKDDWTDLAVNTPESFVQFEISHLAEGRYRSRLQVREQAPRPEAQRLSYTFETDVLTVDRTPPEILDASVSRNGGVWRIQVASRDRLSLLQGAEFVLNNGSRVAVEQPDDGILDSRRETFAAEFREAEASGANSVEILVYDERGNSASRRLPLK